MKEDKGGVSPVIATILMVAMTVVLTAVLYMMVIGLVGPGEERGLWGTFAKVESVSNTSFKLLFGKFSQDVRPMHLEIVVEYDSSMGTYSFSSNQDGELSYAEGVDVCDIYYEDLVDDGLISYGDYLTLSSLSPGGTYTVYLLEASTGSVLAEETWTLPS